MPHATLKIQGGVVVNETPVLNQAGIAASNRIRFKYDPQGLSLPEKLGGWAKFYASQITNGVVRALWGWQDTNNNQWIAFATDNSSPTGAELDVIQCSVNGTTGLTSATGTLKNITPSIEASCFPISVNATSGSNIFTFASNLTPGTLPEVGTVFITTPISVAGVVLQGQYNLVPQTVATPFIFKITALDVLGNPLNAGYTTADGTNLITGVTFSAGPPATLIVTFGAPAYTFPVGGNVNIKVNDNTITGSYIVLASTTSTVTVATTLSSYTFSSSGTISNSGVGPIFKTASSSSIITATLPDHGLTVGNTFDVLNPTLVGGIVIQGQYTVQTAPNSYTFTFNAISPATATSSQYQGALTVTGGSRAGTIVTLNYANGVFTAPFTGSLGYPLFVQGVNPSNWDGWFFQSGSATVTAISYTDSGATGSYVSGGSWAPLGGFGVFVLALTSTATEPVVIYPGAFWSLDNWGNDLLAGSGNTAIVTYPNGFGIPYQPILYWDPTSAFLYAQPVPNGPTACRGFFVAMPERQIIAWGTSATNIGFYAGIIDPLLIRWCDINNFTTWTAQFTNQAGSFRLPSGAAIIGARQVQQQGLLWTDIELWSMQYINQPDVYGFNKIGVGCGLIGKYAHGVLGGVAYWMSKSQFFMLSGDGVVPIPCPIWDVVFQNLDLVNEAKITCGSNAMFQEITWYFPVKGGNGENSQYIKLNVTGLVSGQGPIWDYGSLDRSAFIDVSVLQQPIGFSPVNEFIYQHEISPDADGAAMGETFTTGWFSVMEGDQMSFVDQVWPDFRYGYFGQSQSANVTLTIGGQDYPGQSAQTVGPYTVTQSSTWISPRMRHRLLSFTVAGTGTGTWWRLGGVRYRYQPDGKF